MRGCICPATWASGVLGAFGSVGVHCRAPGRALGLLPLEPEEVLEVGIVPLGRIGSPAALDAVRHRVLARAGAVRVVPAEPHRLHRRHLGRRSDLLGGRHAVALAEGMTAGDERHGLLVVHGHAGERRPDVVGRALRVAVRVGSLGVHVDQRLVGGGEGVLQVVVGVAVLAAPALVTVDHLVEARDLAHLDDLGAPVGGVVRLPGVETSTGESVGRQAHDLQGAVAGEHHQVGPGEGVAVFVLDRLQQPARLVGVAVVPPARDRREALHPGAGPAPAPSAMR